MRIAMLQSAVVPDKGRNLAHARELVARAAAEGADMAVLPEMFCCPYDNACFREYGEPERGEAWRALSETAQANGLYVVGGSVPELEEDRVYNTSYVFDPDGRQIARHRKAHLFDINVPGGQVFCESAVLSKGDQVTTFDTAFGRFGLCVCFDFRSQELAKAMADRGARMIIVPAAFNMTTGPAHWELLFRSRAVDNQIFTMGVATARNEADSYVSYGNSICVDPWGTVLARLGAAEGILSVDVDFRRVDEVRAQLPILRSRRPDLY